MYRLLNTLARETVKRCLMFIKTTNKPMKRTFFFPVITFVGCSVILNSGLELRV